MFINETTFDCTHVGESNEIELLARDLSGNESTAIAIVTVIDPVAPVAVTQDITVALGADGTDTLTATENDMNSSDA